MDDSALRRSRIPSEICKRFLDAVHAMGVKSPRDRWYVFRAEQLEKALRDKDPMAWTQDDVTAYLAELGRSGRLEDWQFRQVVTALEILLSQAMALPWAGRFDWRFWRDSAEQLQPSHPSVAREQGTWRTRPKDHTSRVQSELIALVVAEIRRRNYSIRTEQTYVHWIRRFAAANQDRDLRSLEGAPEVKLFLERLAVEGKVASSTQNQALSALVFLYREVLERALELGDFKRAKRPRHVPVVLTRREVRALLSNLEGTHKLMASLLYGTGMRLMEVIRLRVKDLDFEYKQIVVRNAKGAKDRVVPLPEATVPALREQLSRVRKLYAADRKRGLGVSLPDALARKLPNAPTEWIWQYVFPSGACPPTREAVSSSATTFMRMACRRQ